MEKITCTNCETEYKLVSTKIPARDKDTIYCPKCKCELFSWNEARVWTIVPDYTSNAPLK
jgi:predicted Zn finger-like uncharacterized protein